MLCCTSNVCVCIVLCCTLAVGIYVVVYIKCRCMYCVVLYVVFGCINVMYIVCMCMWLKRRKGIGCLPGVETDPVCVQKNKGRSKER